MPVIDAQELLYLQLDAMRAVFSEEFDFSLRFVCRWYAEKFHTPLHEVGTPGGAVPIEDVLRTFYEVRYHDLHTREPNKLDEEVEKLVRTDEDLAAEALKADLKEYEDFTFSKIVEAQEVAKAKRIAKKKAAMGLVPKTIGDMKLGERSTLSAQPPPTVVPEGALPGGPAGTSARAPPLHEERLAAATLSSGRPVDTNLPPDVKVVFMTDEQIEAEAANLDPFARTRPPRNRPSKR